MQLVINVTRFTSKGDDISVPVHHMKLLERRDLSTTSVRQWPVGKRPLDTLQGLEPD